jgi:ABC-type branched-subunit amino acid transport system substrate-binding protein
MRPVVLLASILASACTLTQNYNQCVVDSDCASENGTPRYCTSDGICLSNTPAERLCTKTLPAVPSPNGVHVGALLDLRLVNGQPAEQLPLLALELAVGEINSAVELDGIRPLVVDVCDVGTSGVDADNATRILIEQRNVVAIIGPNAASAATDMLARIKAAGVPAISPALSDTAIANAASQGLFFRLAPVEAEQGLQLVSQLTTLANGMSTSELGLLNVQTNYGNNIRNRFTAEWQRKDPVRNRTSDFYQYGEGNADLLASTSSLLVDGQPRFAVLIPGADSVAAISSMAGLPLDPKDPTGTTPLLVSSSGRTAELLQQARTGTAQMKAHLGRITGVAPLSFVPAEEGNDFKVSFTAANPGVALERDFMVGYTYDAMYLIGAASAVVKGAQTPAQILSFLRLLTNNAVSLSLRATAFKETVAALTQKPNDPVTLLGVTGAIRFLANGGRDPVLLESWKIDTTAGQYVSTPVPQ